MVIEISLPMVRVNDDGPHLLVKATFSILAQKQELVFWFKDFETGPYEILHGEECKTD
jgi:hypothetical protein